MSVVLLILGTLVATTYGHSPLTNGTSAGPSYSTWQTALTIPSIKFALSARRYSTADGQVFWLKYTAKAGDKSHVGAASGAALANVVLRASAYVFGPGLPNKKYKASQFRVPVPTGTNFGYRFYKGGSNLSNCKFLKNSASKESWTVQTYNGVKRCGSYNNVTGTGSFPLLDHLFIAPADGTYYFAYYLEKTYKAAWTVYPGNVADVEDTEKELPTPPLGNAPFINPGNPNNTVTSSLLDVIPYSFGLKK